MFFVFVNEVPFFILKLNSNLLIKWDYDQVTGSLLTASALHL